jgi:hypothetical protein
VFRSLMWWSFSCFSRMTFSREESSLRFATPASFAS